MFLIGFLSLAAVGGAAYAMSDAFVPEDAPEDEDSIDDQPDDVSEGKYLEIDETGEDAATPQDTADEQEPSTGTVLSEFEGDLIIAGTEEADVLTGQDGDDQINGYGADDAIDGGAGNDVLLAGDGADTVSGGAGEDVLFGGDGDDILTGEEEDDAVDFLNGGAGEDTILADSGDIVTGGDGADEIIVTPEAEDEAVTVMDFQPGQDKLFVSWDGAEDPDIQIETDAENENLTHVLIDGQDVAQLLGAEGLTADDIQLISEIDLAQLVALG